MFTSECPNLKVIPYIAEDKRAWDNFVQNHARNSTIFHEQRFLSYHGDRFRDCSIMVCHRKNNSILAVCPAALKEEDGQLGIISHPGSTYGGIIFRDELKTKALKEIVDVVIKYYSSISEAKFFKIILPEEFHTGNSFGELPFLLWHRGFELASKEASIVIDLENIQACPNFRKTTKQYIKSKKDERLGISHHLGETETEIERAYSLIKHNLNTRYQKDPTHSLKELLLLKRLYREGIKLFYSLFEDKVIGTVVLFELNNNVTHTFYISQNYDYARINPLIGLFMLIFSYYAEKGFKFLNFGISSRGKWIKWGILDFKEQFGGKLLSRDTWILRELSGERPFDEGVS
jgi:hypothetical protein